MLAERPTLTYPSSSTRSRQDWGVVLRLQGYYWLREGVAYGVGLAFVELGFWAMPTELGYRCLAWGEAFLEDALQASCCCTTLAVARSPWTEEPTGIQRLGLPQPPTLRWGTLGSLLLHSLVLLLWIWQGSRPLLEPERQIPITLLELPPEPELAAEPVQDADPQPEIRGESVSLPPPPAAAPARLAERPADPLPRAELGLQTPSPTPMSTPTPPPTPEPAPPPPVPTATLPPTPVPTSAVTPPPIPVPPATPPPTPAPVAQQPSLTEMPASPAVVGTPLPRFTPLIQGISSRQRDGMLSPAEASYPTTTATAPQVASTPSARSDSTPSSSPVAANLQPDVLAQPIPGRNPPPQYPPQARRLNQQGQVILRAKVDAQGRVQQVEILSSSGFPALDSAAQQAVQQWQFRPALKNNVPIESWVTVPIQFALN